jgi:hypothetical protein
MAEHISLNIASSNRFHRLQHVAVTQCAAPFLRQPEVPVYRV